MSTIPYFRNYYWNKGKPIGIEISTSNEAETFKIISDPYKKRFSIEKYVFGVFSSVIYDSNLFDFRHLDREENAAWQREVLEELPHQVRSFIRSIDDRIILIEEAFFEEDCCTFCKIFSPHGIWIATQKILYKSRGGAFDGVVLSDKTDRPILIKRYNIEAGTDKFTTLLSEEWEHQPL